jgi:hypothetical protein
MACCIGFIAPALTYHGRIRIDFLKPSQRLGAPPGRFVHAAAIVSHPQCNVKPGKAVFQKKISLQFPIAKFPRISCNLNRTALNSDCLRCVDYQIHDYLLNLVCVGP